MSEQIISVEEYEERLAAICLNGAGASFPRRFRDRQILYRSIIQTLDGARKYSEPELNDAIQNWLLNIGTCLDMDHVTLRRYLIDEGYLSRNANGDAYQVRATRMDSIEFEPAIAAIDPVTVIQAAKDRMAERKIRQSMRNDVFLTRKSKLHSPGGHTQ